MKTEMIAKEMTEEEKMIENIILAAKKLETAGDTLYEDLSFKQWFLLKTISEISPSLRNLKTIAQKMHTSHQSVKKNLIKLEDLGYIQFSRFDNNRKDYKVILTEKTYAELFNGKQFDIAPIKYWFQLLSEETVQNINESLSQLSQLLDLFISGESGAPIKEATGSFDYEDFYYK